MTREEAIYHLSVLGKRISNIHELKLYTSDILLEAIDMAIKHLKHHLMKIGKNTQISYTMKPTLEA